MVDFMGLEGLCIPVVNTNVRVNTFHCRSQHVGRDAQMIFYIYIQVCTLYKDFSTTFKLGNNHAKPRRIG